MKNARAAVLRWLSATALASCAAYPLSAETPVSGIISTDTTWRLQDSPFIMTGSVDVYSTAGPPPILTIEAGVVVRSNFGWALRVGLGGPGEIRVNGTIGQPVTFTANTGNPTAGYWAGIILFSGTTSTSTISSAVISYGIYGIRIDGCSPAIANTTVQNATTRAVSVEAGSPTISGSDFTNATFGLVLEGAATANVSTTRIANNGTGVFLRAPARISLQTVEISGNVGSAIVMDAQVQLETVSNLTVTRNGRNAVELANGGIGVSTTWKSLGIPYIVTQDISVGGTTAPVLTIEPGVEVRFNFGRVLIVGQWEAGGLHALGTPTSGITFTANSDNPALGYWRGIQFHQQTSASSRIAYAAVRYGGLAANYGGIGMINASPTVENTMIEQNAYAGISVAGGAPTLTSSTIRSNPIGLLGSSAAAPSLQSVTISNNTGGAINVDASVSFSTVSDVVIFGNGTNAVEVRGGGVAQNTTWRQFPVPYIVGGNVWVERAGTPPPVLTIEPGITLRFYAVAGLTVGQNQPGELQAVGTPASPITFTVRTGEALWQGLRLGPQTTPASRIAYAVVSNGGNGGVLIESSSPTIENTTLQNNAEAGITIWGAIPLPNPQIRNCVFVGNPAGLHNSSAATAISAQFNYWNAVNGPSGAGSGSGQSVSAGVRFEPWLTNLPSQPQFFTSFTSRNRAFNPSLSINTTWTLSSSLSGNWTVSVMNAGGATIRTFSGTGASATVVWDGKNAAGDDQPSGTYTYELTSTAGADTATPARGLSVLDRNRQVIIADVALSNTFFSPNADGVQDTTTISGIVNFDDVTWTINIRNMDSAVVRSASGEGPAISYTWDGRNTSDIIQPDGPYSLAITATAGTGTASASRTATLDNTIPNAIISSPGPTQTLSNVYQSGATDVTVTGTIADGNLDNWRLEYGLGPTPSAWALIALGTAPISAAPIGTWATLPLNNGLYSLRLQAWDRAGNRGSTTHQPTIGNFKVSQSTLKVNREVTGSSVTYSSIVPFLLAETLVVKNAAGDVVRTLVNAARSADTYNDAWDGRNEAGAALADGPYFYIATVTDGTYSLTWDLTAEFWNNYSHYQAFIYDPAARFEPFNNRPLTLTYYSPFEEPGRFWVLFTPNQSLLDICCVPDTSVCNQAPNFCLPAGEYQAGATRTIAWAGTDPAGLFRRDIKGIGMIMNRRTFSKNAVVLYGTAATVTNLSVTPPFYTPARGEQAAAFDLATYQNQPVTVTVTFQRQASASVLKTITRAAQAPGRVTLSWDGRAENGAWVAPGFYTVTITVTDSLGNNTRSHSQMVVAY